jgi:hypothetical protein
MNNELILMLIAAYLYQLNNPTENDVQVAAGVAADLARFGSFLKGLDKTSIERMK